MYYLVSITENKFRAHTEFSRLTSFGENVLEERNVLGTDVFKKRYNSYIGTGDDGRHYWDCSRDILGEVISKLIEGLPTDIEVTVQKLNLSNLPKNLRNIIEGVCDQLGLGEIYDLLKHG